MIATLIRLGFGFSSASSSISSGLMPSVTWSSSSRSPSLCSAETPNTCSNPSE